MAVELPRGPENGVRQIMGDEIHGNKDEVVPLDENSSELARRYREQRGVTLACRIVRSDCRQFPASS